MLLTFKIDDWTCGIDIDAVEKTYRAAALTPLPDAPHFVLGILDVRGEVLPVVSLRRRFSLPDKALSPTDCFIVARTPQRPVILVADDLGEVFSPDAAALHPAEHLLPALAYLAGVVSTQQGLILIQDLAKLLSLDEAAALDLAMHHYEQGAI
jgi:purine-binding chemotaxis protein CheW